MNLTDQLLAALSQYGLPVLFTVIMIAAVGVPLPVTLMLVAAGSFVELGEMKLWQVIMVASGAAVMGDQVGYALGRWGGHHLLARIKRRPDRALKIKQAAAFAQRWGGAGIFFGNLGWVIVGLTAAVLVGWQLLRYLRPVNSVKSGKSISGATA